MLQEVPEEKAEEQTTETEGGVQEETKDEAMDTAAAGRQSGHYLEPLPSLVCMWSAESAAAPASSEGGDKAEENNEVGKEERKRPREDDDHGRRRDRGQ